MSWGFGNPCWNCKRKDNGCKDYEKVQEAITKIHEDPDHSTKGGGGEIVMCCTRMNT
jgi:hypothetical protein